MAWAIGRGPPTLTPLSEHAPDFQIFFVSMSAATCRRGLGATVRGFQSLRTDLLDRPKPQQVATTYWCIREGHNRGHNK